ncbi:fructose-1,6-bisphosphatase [Candidatus Dojkabacteria bacterium]|uniref:Fructose-1,6-bisphosphatase class 1 n=1 Tax=Candidatus Dojkabacteria bacterium TaxID=2099670 RepID=A0A955RJ08_9BACT|nr:fructose-1,6-bisphosphatase [Candidatus Dojkabacteria bacterium]
MIQRRITLRDFIDLEDKLIATGTGEFKDVVMRIVESCLEIAGELEMAELSTNMGESHSTNIFGEVQKKLDIFSNDRLVKNLSESTAVYSIASEEMDTTDFVNKQQGRYTVFFDPIDGSSNLASHISLGTLFSIFSKEDKILLPGNQQLAAGYMYYSNTIEFVYTSRIGKVNIFTLDQSSGEFILTHKNIRMPSIGKIYSINEGRELLFSKSLQNYLKMLKEHTYKLRYVGSMAADIHRTLMEGGIFLYPSDKENPNGKLRLLFEVNPVAMIVENAGGLARVGTENPLDITPESTDQRVPVVLGSKREVEYFLNMMM